MDHEIHIRREQNLNMGAGKIECCKCGKEIENGEKYYYKISNEAHVGCVKDYEKCLRNN